MMTKINYFILMTLILLGGLFAVQPIGQANAKDGAKLLEFDTMSS